MNRPPTRKTREAASPANKTYHIRYYGSRIDIPFIHTFPNLLSVREVPQEELQARAKAAADARRAAQGQGQQVQPVVQPNGQAQPVQGGGQQAAVGALSGTMITFETVVDGQKISMTVPIEAANKITVNKVQPLVAGGRAEGTGTLRHTKLTRRKNPPRSGGFFYSSQCLSGQGVVLRGWMLYVK